MVENPLINRITFEGNKEVSDEELASTIELVEGILLGSSRLDSDVDRILELYRRAGRFAAAVNPRVIELEEGLVDLVFVIEERAP